MAPAWSWLLLGSGGRSDYSSFSGCGSLMSGFSFKGMVQMEQVSSSFLSCISSFLQQLKQSGMSSLGMMKREPKYLWRVMKPSRIMLMPTNTISILTLFGSRVKFSRQYLQQTKGTLVKMMVRSRVIDIPPLPPKEYAQLICIASSRNPSQIQNTRFRWKTYTRLKQISRKKHSIAPFFLLLNSLNTTLSYLRRKNRLSAMLAKAQQATYLRLVSSLLRAQLKKMMLVATTKAATCTIIHYDRLYTDFLALKKATAIRKRKVQVSTVRTKVVYQFQIGLRNALKLKELDQNLISILVLLSIGQSSRKLLAISRVMPTLNLPMTCLLRRRMQVTNLGLGLDHSRYLPSDCTPFYIVGSKSIWTMTVAFSLYLPSQSLRYSAEAYLPSWGASKNASASTSPSGGTRKLSILVILFLRSDCSLIMVSLLLIRKLLSDDSFQNPFSDRFTTCRLLHPTTDSSCELLPVHAGGSRRRRRRVGRRVEGMGVRMRVVIINRLQGNGLQVMDYRVMVNLGDKYNFNNQICY